MRVSECKQKELINFIMGNDMDFYEQFLSNLSECELQCFYDENPDFMAE